MNIKITAKKIQINDAFTEYANAKLKKLDRFFGDDADAKIRMSTIKDKIILEVTVTYDALLFRAEQAAADKNDALDACIDKIIRQIRKNKTKVEKRLRDTAFKESYDDVVEDQKNFDIIKRKKFVLRPMSVDEAVLQMNMLDHTFFMFKNAESGETCVVYKRQDGNYAVLEPSKD